MAESSRFSPLARALIGGACFVILVTGMQAAADLFYGLHPSDWLFFLLIPPTLLALLQYGPKEAVIVVVG